jgi:hypothetical protein
LNIYDKVIIGGGFYGLYAAMYAGRNGERVLLLEKESAPFMRATYINQARVHMGYHYPRSISTALKSRGYFDRFTSDFGFCVVDQFEQVYALSSDFSWTNAEQFVKFCRDSGIYCAEVYPERYFKPGMCDGAFITKEYAYDAHILRDHLVAEIEKFPNVELVFGVTINAIENDGTRFLIETGNGKYASEFVLNATYASTNQIHALLGYEPFKIKYELCEIILCKVSDSLKNLGLTVMDGTFFSIMPFGKTDLHSLTSVSFTPHATSFDDRPMFECQARSGGYCSSVVLGNCNQCVAKSETSYPYMSQLARKYMRDELGFEYVSSLFSMKPILKASEIDDSRPTVIRQSSENPDFYSVLSGKINTVYDLEEILDEKQGKQFCISDSLRSQRSWHSHSVRKAVKLRT